MNESVHFAFNLIYCFFFIIIIININAALMCLMHFSAEVIYSKVELILTTGFTQLI